MKTVATLCAGGELFGVGARAAGLRHLWGIESEPAIARVAEDNGFCIVTAKIQEVDYTSLEIPWWLHMSPPCINASQAKASVGETELDIELARACIKAIETLMPSMVSLENVWGYRKFESFKLICRALRAAGYALDYWHLNAADYGVPQTRKRLFLVASRVQRPRKPAATHQKARPCFGQLSLLDALPAWRGWYEAIEDLIPGLPDDEFAPWQLPLLPVEIQTMLIAQGKYGGKLVMVNEDEPSFTITANSNQSGIRGVLVRCDNAKQEWGKGYRSDSETSVTVTSKGMKAWLVNQDSKLGTYQADSPAMTVLSSEKSAFIRAFLADGTANDNGRSLTIRGCDSPGYHSLCEPGEAGRKGLCRRAGCSYDCESSSPLSERP
jgi:site-specific DNA-cytosine methylase